MSVYHEQISENEWIIGDYRVTRTSDIPERFSISNDITRKSIPGCYNLKKSTMLAKMERLLKGLSPDMEEQEYSFKNFRPKSRSGMEEILEQLQKDEIPSIGNVKMAPGRRNIADIRNERMKLKYQKDTQ